MGADVEVGMSGVAVEDDGCEVVVEWLALDAEYELVASVFGTIRVARSGDFSKRR